MRMANPKAYELAGRLGKVLEGQSVQDTGVALGIVLGQFILLMETSDKGIDAGVQAVADDAKLVARQIRNFRQ